ncbi:cytochrome C nitrite reductase [bacterium]|nr:cytochrome C nitrite reductase [bacterium]
MGYHGGLRKPAIGVLAAGIVVGILVAAAVFTGYHASGSPAICVACHSMKPMAEQWRQSMHKQYACIECHLPDANIAMQVTYKARAGLHDLYHETLRSYPAAIRLTSEARGIAEGNCLRCHFSTVGNTFMAVQGASCLQCHQRVVHGPAQETGGIKVE